MDDALETSSERFRDHLFADRRPAAATYKRNRRKSPFPLQTPSGYLDLLKQLPTDLLIPTAVCDEILEG